MANFDRYTSYRQSISFEFHPNVHEPFWNWVEWFVVYSVKRLCKTLAGNNCEMLTITSTSMIVLKPILLILFNYKGIYLYFTLEKKPKKRNCLICQIASRRDMCFLYDIGLYWFLIRRFTRGRIFERELCLQDCTYVKSRWCHSW